ncbi:Transforming acidic coiled-coil-containing protein 2 [Halotydeus destructor]|nr:Transforming acidic coiled-coil-containing protein 2 [Halotydeus destructor]
MALNDVKNLMDFITPVKSESKMSIETNGNHDIQENNFQTRTLDLMLQEKIIMKDKEISYLQDQLTAANQRNQFSKQLMLSLKASSEQLAEQFTQVICAREAELEEAFQKLQEVERDRDVALNDCNAVERSFSELHGRYDKMKNMLENAKANEDDLNKTIEELEDRLRHQTLQYDALKTKAEEALDSVQAERESLHIEKEKEMTQLRVQAKRNDMRANGLQAQLDQKVQETLELTKMLDELTSTH